MILVLGLVFLTVQAVEHDWLGPQVAVCLAAVLCLAVITWAVVSHGRSPDGPVAPALLTVGVIGLFSDTWVTVFGLGWIPHWAGAVLIGLVCAVGLGVARWWDLHWLAFTLVLTGGLFLAPAGIWLNQDGQVHLVESGCLVTLGILGWAATWRRDWIPVDAAAAVVFVSGVTVNRPDDTVLFVTVASVAALAVVTVLSLTPTAGSAGAAVTATVLTRGLPASFVPVLVLLDTGAWTVGGLAELSAGQWCALGVAVLTCAVPLTRQVLVRESLRLPPRPAPVPPAAPVPSARPGYMPGYGRVSVPGYGQPYAPGYGPVPGRPVTPVVPPAPATVADAMRAVLAAGLAALTAALLSSGSATDGPWWLCAMILVAGVLAWCSPLLPRAFPWVFGAVTTLAGLPLLGPAWERSVTPEAHLLWLPGLFYLGLAVLTAVRSGELQLTGTARVVCVGVLTVLGSTAVPLLARDFSDTPEAFMAGQLVVSVLWMLSGVLLLLQVDARAGLGVALVATAKLVLYDLATLDGLIQVAAFILCGLILLACAAFRDRDRRRQEGPAAEN